MAENGAKKKLELDKVTVVFKGDDRAIYAKLAEDAKLNRRDIDQEILATLASVGR